MNYYDTINLSELIEGSLVSMGLTSNVANANMLKYIDNMLSKRLGGSAFLKDEIDIIASNEKDSTMFKFKTFYTPKESRILIAKNKKNLIVSMDLDGEHHIIETNNDDLLTIDQTNEYKYDKINVSFEDGFLNYVTLRTLDMESNKETASSMQPLYVKDNEKVYMSYTSEIDGKVATRDRIVSMMLENRSSDIIDYIPNIIDKQRKEMSKDTKETYKKSLHK